MKLSQMFYLANWFFGARVLGRKRPLQTVLFISDKCNLKCKHCSVYAKADPHIMTYEEIRGELEYAYRLGSRFVDFEGGEVMIWRDGDYRIDDVIDLAREVGFFSATITTNAQLPFRGSHADSIWVSLNFYTPFPDAENLMITREQREEVIDTVIRMKREGYPIMNSISGLRLMKHNRFKRRCWVTNFIYADHKRANCAGEELGICRDCGLCMAGEMNAVFNFRPDTILAGLKLRL